MPGHQYLSSPKAILHKRALARGWFYSSTRGGKTYYNPMTGQRSTQVPLPSGWSRRSTPGGTRYVSVSGRVQGEMPTSSSVAAPTAAKSAAAAADKPTGSARPKPVVAAKGLLNGDTDRPLVASGGKPILTTPFGIMDGAPVKKKKLLGA